MKLKKPGKKTFLDTCAASDMAFLLIIYFMVIAGFNVNMGFMITLPARDSTRLILREDLLRFSIDRDGYITYYDSLIGIEEAGNIIRSTRVANPNVAVILTIDPQARWQRVVYFVELAQDLQIESFSFSMSRETMNRETL